jgi:hypothetical protein
MVYIYTFNEILFSLKKREKNKEILPPEIWTNLENIMVSGIRQGQKDKYRMISLHFKKLYS